jgi:nicotinamide mononucleotide transporter
MIEWLINNWIEITGVVFTLIFLSLEVLGKWSMWIIGIISGLFYVWINCDAHLYALMGLSVFNTLISLYGLYCWKFAKTKDNKNLKFNFIEKKLALLLVLIGMAVFIAIAFILIQFTDTPNPFTKNGEPLPFILDSLITTLSIIAVWMAAKKIIESWYLWLFVNPCTILLYVYKEMYPSTALYIVYTFFSIVGYLQWKKLAIQQNDSINAKL